MVNSFYSMIKCGAPMPNDICHGLLRGICIRHTFICFGGADFFWSTLMDDYLCIVLIRF